MRSLEFIRALSSSPTHSILSCAISDNSSTNLLAIHESQPWAARIVWGHATSSQAWPGSRRFFESGKELKAVKREKATRQRIWRRADNVLLPTTYVRLDEIDDEKKDGP